MDAKLFRLPTSPNFYSGISTANPFELKEQKKRTQIPTRDSRFPGWAAQMEDGRLVTEYNNHCSRNVPTGKQFATKEWMTKNALEIIRIGRQRNGQQTGSIYAFDSTVVPPPAIVVKCATDDCVRLRRNTPGAIGMERDDTPCPELFGTWDYQDWKEKQPRSKTHRTTVYEGGRNTPRGISS